MIHDEYFSEEIDEKEKKKSAESKFACARVQLYVLVDYDCRVKLLKKVLVKRRLNGRKRCEQKFW